MKFWQQYRGIIILSTLFAGVYALVSLVNHYQFRTFALDLGAYTNALFDYRQGQFNDSTVFKAQPENLLSDHLDMYLIIFSPLSYLFGSYTLLLIQIAGLIFGGWGVYVYMLSRSNSKHLAFLAAFYFFSFFGIFGALSFDYHSSVVASCFIPWLLFAIHVDRKRHFVFWFFVILIAKENMSMWLIFVCLGLTIEHWRSPAKRRLMLAGVVFSALCFVLITGTIMPAASNGGKFIHFRYQVLGSGFGDAIHFIITQPLRVMEVFFCNHLKDADGDGVKMELHILLLVSGIYFLLRRPSFLFMLIPIFFQKLYHDSLTLWGIGLHYNIEFAPILAIGVFEAIIILKDQKHRVIVGYAIVVSCCSATWRMMDKTARYWEMPRVQLHKPWHYNRDFDVEATHAIIDQLPPQAKVSCQSPFLPHLALRDKVYQFPMVHDAEYIIISKQENPYPLTTEALEVEVDKLVNSEEWQVERQSPVVVLKRK